VIYDDGRDDYWDRYDDGLVPRRGAAGCQCGNDLPGRCPGSDICPLCEPMDTDTDTDEEEADHE